MHNLNSLEDLEEQRWQRSRFQAREFAIVGPDPKRAKTPLTNFLRRVKRLTSAMWFSSQANYPLLFLGSFLTFPVREANCQSANSNERAQDVLFPRRKLVLQTRRAL